MKRILFILVAFFIAFLYCTAQQAHWTDISGNITSSSGTPDFSDVCFIGSEGWVTCENLSEYYYTADGGNTFSVRVVPNNTFFNSISMRTATEGYAAAQNGKIYRSTDGGQTWNSLGTNMAAAKSISYRSVESGKWGYACGDNGTISRVTPDYVVHDLSGLTQTLKSTSCPEGNCAWICGGSSLFRFYISQTLFDQVFPAGDYNTVYMLNNLTGWAGGTNGAIIHTSDGINWSAQVNPDMLNRALNDIFFLNADTGWAVGADGLILHTSDGGTTWSVEATGLMDKTLTSVQFTNSDNGYAVGKNKTLLRFYATDGINDPSVQTCFQSKIYPNPFSGSTVISWQSAAGSQQSVLIKVFDFMGKEISTLVDGEMTSGEHQVTFDATALPAGVYFYQLQVNGTMETRKMMIIK